MNDIIKSTIEVSKHVAGTLTTTKSGFVGVFITWLSSFWIEWGNPLVAFLTAIFGLAYIVLVLRIKMIEWKIIKEIEKSNKLDKG